MITNSWFDRILGLSRPYQEALAAAEQAREQQVSKIQALEADLAKWKAESDTARQQNKAAQHRVTDLEQQLAIKADAIVEAQKVNELTLLQLHQVQEELESSFLKHRNKGEQIQLLEGQVTALRRELTAISQARDEALQISADQKEQLAIKANALVEAQKEIELTSLHLHQVQKELESSFLKHRDKDELLQALEGQVTALRREQAAISQARDEALQISADQKQQLAIKANALVEAQKEIELTLLQLYQVQEELEHYFLQSRAGDELAQAQQQQLQRAQALIGRLLPNVAATEQSLEITRVQVLNPQQDMPRSSLQTEALLYTYSASLKRAVAILQRVMNR